MVEINERQYMMDLGDEHMIVWERHPSVVMLKYVSINNQRTIIREYTRSSFAIGIHPVRRFFRLTDEEVKCMVLPRII